MYVAAERTIMNEYISLSADDPSNLFIEPLQAGLFKGGVVTGLPQG